ncbi:MAG: GNAT family N-acetyltransferase [Armatimonadota bacterium]
MEIRTGRLLLRPLVATDAPAIQQMASDPKIAATTLAVPHPYPDGAAAAWIESHSELRQRHHRIWGIERHGDGTVVGTVALRGNPVHRRAELGYWIGVPFQGHGYATEAVRAVVRFGFEIADLERIYAQHLDGNLASGRVMQKAGLRFEGILRHCVFKDGRHWDTPMYAILSSDER